MGIVYTVDVDKAMTDPRKRRRRSDPCEDPGRSGFSRPGPRNREIGPVFAAGYHHVVYFPGVRTELASERTHPVNASTKSHIGNLFSDRFPERANKFSP